MIFKVDYSIFVYHSLAITSNCTYSIHNLNWNHFFFFFIINSENILLLIISFDINNRGKCKLRNERRENLFVQSFSYLQLLFYSQSNSSIYKFRSLIIREFDFCLSLYKTTENAVDIKQIQYYLLFAKQCKLLLLFY